MTPKLNEDMDTELYSQTDDMSVFPDPWILFDGSAEDDDESGSQEREHAPHDQEPIRNTTVPQVAWKEPDADTNVYVEPVLLEESARNEPLDSPKTNDKNKKPKRVAILGPGCRDSTQPIRYSIMDNFELFLAVVVSLLSWVVFLWVIFKVFQFFWTSPGPGSSFHHTLPNTTATGLPAKPAEISNMSTSKDGLNCTAQLMQVTQQLQTVTNAQSKEQETRQSLQKQLQQQSTHYETLVRKERRKRRKIKKRMERQTQTYRTKISEYDAAMVQLQRRVRQWQDVAREHEHDLRALEEQRTCRSEASEYSTVQQLYEEFLAPDLDKNQMISNREAELYVQDVNRRSKEGLWWGKFEFLDENQDGYVTFSEYVGKTAVIQRRAME